eukprot:TRINITY_DN27417_c0_g1_i1.p1 TRINITY_DN27417_c0_g1~~TRINITY_DN27417_c0_g1_i1.p1  ORF type:complete len:156 (+),score=15.44 TRINITY_DN27417_c0_g1_i1:40-468(+)
MAARAGAVVAHWLLGSPEISRSLSSAPVGSAAVATPPLRRLNEASGGNFTSEAELAIAELRSERSATRRSGILEDQVAMSSVGLCAVGAVMCAGAWRYRTRRQVAREERLLNRYACELSDTTDRSPSGSDGARGRLPAEPVY